MTDKDSLHKAAARLRAIEKEYHAKAQDAVEGVVLGFYGTVGGAEAVKHEKAAIEAMKAGHIKESLESSSKLNGDIIAHLTGRDVPSNTQGASSSSKSSGAGRRR